MLTTFICSGIQALGYIGIAYAVGPVTGAISKKLKPMSTLDKAEAYAKEGWECGAAVLALGAAVTVCYNLYTDNSIVQERENNKKKEGKNHEAKPIQKERFERGTQGISSESSEDSSTGPSGRADVLCGESVGRYDHRRGGLQDEGTAPSVETEAA